MITKFALSHCECAFNVVH